MSRKYVAPLLVAGLSLSTYTLVGQAQSPEGAAQTGVVQQDPEAFAIEEVVVTARRTQENIQEVPLAITALSSDDLARESITSAQDLMGKVASLVIGPNSAMRNSESPNIRGQGATFSASAGVAMYWNEVPLPQDAFTNNQGGPGMLFDVQNLQVLKGPQGTLFGRNTTGGAFVIEPTKPQDTFSARVQVESGNYDDRAYEAVVNVPLVSDRLLLRVGAQSVERDGYTKDVITGKDYDDKNYWTSRLGLTLRVGDNIENTLMSYYTERDENGTGVVFEGVNAPALNAFVTAAVTGVPDPNSPLGCTTIALGGATTTASCGQDVADQQAARDIRHVAMSGDPMDELETAGAVDVFSWQINDSLTLRNILSWSSYKRRFNWDQDGSLLVMNDIRASDAYSTDSETITEELQLQGTLKDQGLKYVVGTYYESSEPQSLQENPTIALGFPATQYYEIEKSTRALYAQGDFSLGSVSSSLDGWTLTAGVRRTVDEMEGDVRLTNDVRPQSNIENSGHTEQYATTWLLSASYQFDNAMVYGKIARGYKTGGFTGLSPNPANFYYDPEYVLSYELGAKSDFEIAEMPIRLNGAIFLSDYEDMQRVSPEIYNGAVGLSTFNAGEAEIKGFEMDFIVLATERVRLMGNYSYTDAEFKEFLVPRQAPQPQADCNRPDVQNGEIGDYSCMPFSEIPEHQYSLSVAYELPLDLSIGTVEASLTYSWVDERYTAPLSIPETEPGAWLEDFSTVNASISWKDIFESRFDVQLFGTNLTDKEYRVANSNVWTGLAFKNSMWSEPRMYGVRVGYRWGDE